MDTTGPTVPQCVTLQGTAGEPLQQREPPTTAAKASAFPNPVTSKVVINVPDIKGSAAL